MTADLPKLALSIRQPWAALIMSGQKQVENRSWATKVRGPIWIHASKTYDKEAKCAEFYDMLGEFGIIRQHFDCIMDLYGALGGIIGSVDLTDCVTQMHEPFFFGPYGFVLRNPEPCEFKPCRGMLGFFTPGEI